MSISVFVHRELNTHSNTKHHVLHMRLSDFCYDLMSVMKGIVILIYRRGESYCVLATFSNVFNNPVVLLNASMRIKVNVSLL